MSNLLKHLVYEKVYCSMFLIMLLSFIANAQIKNDTLFKKKSYFPILPGSFWKYLDREAVVPNEIETQIDSIISVKDTTDGQLVTLLNRLGTGKSRMFYYLVKNNGYVYKLINTKDNKWYLYGNVDPKKGEKIPNYPDTTLIREYKTIYNQLPAINNDCLCLEPYSLDSVDSAKKKSWSGYVFCKGVGEIFHGGVDWGWDLIEYRIGKNSKVTNLSRPVRENK